MGPSYTIEEYVTYDGVSPFADWLLGLKDKRLQAKIRARLARAAFGNFGDWKALKDAQGIYELREHSGAGYRIFYAVIDGKIVLLLAGSSKKDQQKSIAKAKEYLSDYQTRRLNHDN